ncbi:MAG: DUF58 domain-containing protein [bacterium]|nr:DUF58 domain-containing protein [bacterium]
MIPKEILKHIHRIEITTSRLVNDIFCGQYESVFKGRGMEFSEVREYQPGDDIRTIDWNVTARFGHPFVKKFVEERELTVMLLVDSSGSQHFGTRDKLKAEIAAEISSVLAFSAIKNNDRVGLISFTDQIELFIPPKKGSSHILRLIRDIIYHEPEGKGTDIKIALEYLNDVIKRKAVVFLISDFKSSEFEHVLKVTNKHHDLIAIRLVDPVEEELPALGRIQLEDAETGEITVINTTYQSVREAYSSLNLDKTRALKNLFKTTSLDWVEISTDKSYVKPLIAFFRARARRFR